MIDPRRHSDAVQRNREPILGVLRAHVRPGDHVLELAAGTGEHAVFLAPRLGVGSWRATDPDPEARASVDAWRAVSDAPMVLPAEALGVHTGPWPAPGQVDVMVAINLVHISPWEATLALLGDSFVAVPIGEVKLKGKDVPVRVHRIAGPARPASALHPKGEGP